MMAAQAEKAEILSGEAVAAYKRILAAVLDRRPSGTRQRLAAALAKNRSFISQISNPAYPTPIPANHLEAVFDICHFSPAERKQFMEAYGQAHPKRLALIHGAHRLKPHTVYLPDLGDDARNDRLHAMVGNFVRQMAQLMEQEPRKGKRR